MKKISVLAFLLILFSLSSFAQKDDEVQHLPKAKDLLRPYISAIGFRMAFDIGLSFKHFTAKKNFYEVSVSHRFLDYGGIKGVFIYGRQIPNTWDAILIPHLSWFYGVGASIAYYNPGKYPIAGKSGFYPTHVFPFGINALFGTEFRFPTLPLALSFDVRPYYEFNKPGPYFSDYEATLRYVF